MELQRYGFEMTLSYKNAAGDTVVKRADLDAYTVFTSFSGKNKPYTAGVDYDSKYFATLVVSPLINGNPIEGGSTLTVTAFTVSNDGYRHSYGADMITLVFDGEGTLVDPSANVQ